MARLTIATLSQLEAGRFTVILPPYLIHYNDQITINGEAISDQDLQAYLDSTSSSCSWNNQGHLSRFDDEVMTAIAYDYFAHEELDYDHGSRYGGRLTVPMSVSLF